jgi:oligopeptide transport system substrate-binding protein
MKTIQQYGSNWILPGNIVTDGPFMLERWNRGVSSSFIKNPFFPKDFHNTYGGNIERRSVILVKDANTAYRMFQNNSIDSGPVLLSEQQKILADPELSKQVVRASDLSTVYIGFAYDKPPFDNVHVRRAFSAILDRKRLVSDLLSDRGVPMAHFMPPGIFGAVGIDEVGIGDPKNLGFDPQYAKREFEAAGYNDCNSFPTATYLDTSSGYAEFLQNAIEQYLGCDPNKINLQQVTFQVLTHRIVPSVPTPQRPNMWTLSWAADFLDAQDWMFAVLSCKSVNPAKRPCGDIDRKIDAAGKETDSKKRADDYRALEEAFFGQDGEFPIAPLFTPLHVSIVKPWFHGPHETDGLGGTHWDSYHIDQAAQLAARGGA